MQVLEAAQNQTGIPNGKLGLWFFLASEVMLFGGLISSYVILRTGSLSFGLPPRELLGVPLATLNTFVLITSSVTMVLALSAMQEGKISAFRNYMLSTIGLGFAFLGIKGIEYHHKISEGITIASTLFGSFYFTLTGLHALHVIGGIILNAIVLLKGLEGRLINPDHPERVEYAGLYWHFVDIVWVFLFPILYLI